MNCDTCIDWFEPVVRALSIHVKKLKKAIKIDGERRIMENELSAVLFFIAMVAKPYHYAPICPLIPYFDRKIIWWKSFDVPSK